MDVQDLETFWNYTIFKDCCKEEMQNEHFIKVLFHQMCLFFINRPNHNIFKGFLNSIHKMRQMSQLISSISEKTKNINTLASDYNTILFSRAIQLSLYNNEAKSKYSNEDIEMVTRE